MARDEGASNSSSRDLKKKLSGLRSRFSNSWWGDNWHTVAIIVGLLFVALFLRSYFGYSMSVDNGFIVSGGSDSYYHERVIAHVMDTGTHLVQDPMLNYPMGMRNARPPLYDWSVAVSGQLLSGLGMDEAAAMGYSLVLSTAIWGALTLIPVYLIGRAAFGNRAGLVAALLFAIMPGHIQRSVLSNADHDALILFLAMWSFYFLLMALKSVSGDRWVKSWGNRHSIKKGLVQYCRENQVSLLYAALAGISLAAVAMTWTGYAYLLVIVLAYFLVQLFLNRFKGLDSLGLLMTITVMLSVAFLIAAPVYYQMNYWNVWFDIPVYLFLAAVVVGIIFITTRDYPWTLVIPSFVILSAFALLALSIFMPNLFDAIATGQGYFVKSKLYSTISEAQAPNFSNLVLSFGAVTFWLAFAGVVWAAWKIPRKISHYLIFVVVWAGVSMFMAISAGRFMFNAAPAFAVAGGWVVAIIIDHVNFDSVPKLMSGFWSNPATVIKRAVKIRHVLGALFLAFMILLPNVWTAVDAGIPSQLKQEYDQEVMDVLPGFLKPADYNPQNGSWYFGAFSYNLPLPETYWPTAWEWYRSTDSDIQPPSERPAFLSWWDYGFEAAREGQHPTVADNFQNAYQYAGSFITSQNESDAMALLISRVLDKTGVSENDTINTLLEKYGVNTVKLNDIFENPSRYIQVVKNNPEVYGPYDSELSAPNAKYAAARIEIAKIGTDAMAALYHDLRKETGVDIGYFAIDSRLFPFSATGYNILYAPVKLSDHRIDQFDQPMDFYRIYAVDQMGNMHALENVTQDMTIVDYSIQYQPMFYNSMLYRTFMGYGPQDIGEDQQGIPGISGSLQNLPPMQGWNLTHFRMVYRTAYYNPFPEETVRNHTDAWRAISYDEGLELRDKIEKGEAQGVVDLSAYSLRSGVVFLQYYDGAIIEGTATTESGTPYANAWVTVLDEYGIPHHTVKTDSQGHYRALAPFGDVKVIYSYGELDLRRQVATEIGRESFNISHDQAMRKKIDKDGDGVWDYKIDGDVTLPGASVDGRVYWDQNQDGKYNPGTDQPISNASVAIEGKEGFDDQVTTNSTGQYSFSSLPPMNATLSTEYQGRVLDREELDVMPMGEKTVDFPVRPSGLEGTLFKSDGAAAADTEVVLKDLADGTTQTKTTDQQGAFSFTGLLPGNYSLGLKDPSLSIGQQMFNLRPGNTTSQNFTIHKSMKLSGQVTVAGKAVSNATLGITSQQNQIWITTDSMGRFSTIVPMDDYTLHAMAVKEGVEYSALQHVSQGEEVTVNLALTKSNVLKGTLEAENSTVPHEEIVFKSMSNGATVSAVTDAHGRYRVSLPAGSYFVYASSEGHAYWNDFYLSASTQKTLKMTSSVDISGKVWTEQTHDSMMNEGEGMSSVSIEVTDQKGRGLDFFTDQAGDYDIKLVPGNSYQLEVSVSGYHPIAFTHNHISQSEVKNIQMIPLNRTVTGKAMLGTAPLSSVNIQFLADGGGAIESSVVTDANGSFSLSLFPGDYQINVDQNVTAGDNQTRYQHYSAVQVQVGEDPAPLNLSVVKRQLVTGQISPDRDSQARITFHGPETKEISTESSFQLYLQEGEYDVYVTQRAGFERYGYLDNITVDETTSPLNIATERAYLLSGRLTYDGEPFDQQAEVTLIKDAGGQVDFQADTVGRFEGYLPADTYTLSVDHRTLERIDAEQRYVRYHATHSVELLKNTQVSVPLEREYDNVTLSGLVLGTEGTPVSAQMQFTPLSETAMGVSTTVDPSGYAVSIAPGEYSLYVTQTGAPSVYLDRVEIAPYQPQSMNITLKPGLKFSGKTVYADRGGQAEMSISGKGELSLTSAPDGTYKVLLPAGDYNVSVQASSVERTVEVDYNKQIQLTLDQQLTRTITLDKVERRDVRVEWDSKEKVSVSPGGEAIYTLRIVNTGNVKDTYVLAANTEWGVEFSQKEVTIDYGVKNSQLVTVYIDTPEDAKVSSPPIDIWAVSKTDNVVYDSAEVSITILPTHSVSLTFDKPYATEGKKYSFSMRMENGGNAEDSFRVKVANSQQLASLGWSCELEGKQGFDPSNVTLGSGAARYFDVTLTPIRKSPDLNAEVVIVVQSKEVPDVSTSFTKKIDLPSVVIPDGELTVSGKSVSFEPSQMPLSTIILAGMTGIAAVVMILLGIQRGVFKRKER